MPTTDIETISYSQIPGRLTAAQASDGDRILILDVSEPDINNAVKAIELGQLKDFAAPEVPASGVTSFNGREGAITLIETDIPSEIARDNELSAAVSALQAQINNAINALVATLGSLSTQDADSVTLTGGAINGVAIGVTTPSAGNFTSLKGYRPAIAVTGSKTFALADASTFQFCNSATAQTLTVPPNSVVAYPVGTEIEVYQYGTGTVTIAAGSGVTIQKPASRTLAIAGQYEAVCLKKIAPQEDATDEWVLIGALGAA